MSTRRAVALSTASTIVVLAALVALFLAAPGSKQVRHTFFSPHDMWQSLIGNPKQGYYSVGEALWLNIRMFLVAEVLILALALVIAVIRQSTGPVLFPLRVISTVYVDLFRGVPLHPGHLRARIRGARPQPEVRVRPVGRRSTGWPRWCCPTPPTSPRCTGPG